ncbi:MAG: hypothetical protein AB7S41_17645 [Parvibaculaceae bacterium]
MSARTRFLELDAATAAMLEQRAAARGLTVAELVAELADRDIEPVQAEAEEIVDLDAEWSAVAADGAVPHAKVVRWLQSWGTDDFRSWREE